MAHETARGTECRGLGHQCDRLRLQRETRSTPLGRLGRGIEFLEDGAQDTETWSNHLDQYIEERRLEVMTRDRPSAAEEEYFARQEVELRRVNALETQRQMERVERERLKAVHYMRCPKCGMALEAVTLKGVQIDRCYSCNGTWLDEGELEQLAGKEPGVLQKIVGMFRGGRE